jgi:hypothetical protein
MVAAMGIQRPATIKLAKSSEIRLMARLGPNISGLCGGTIIAAIAYMQKAGRRKGDGTEQR